MERKFRLYDVGSMDAELLYDIAICLTVLDGSFCFDRDSEFYRAFRSLMNSAWSALPEVVTIDLREPSL